MRQTSCYFQQNTNKKNPNIYEQFFEEVFERMEISVKDILKEYNIQDLINIKNPKKEGYLNNIKALYDIVCERTSSKSLLRGIELSQEEIKEFEERIIERYPNVGKSNLSILKNLKKLEPGYLKYVREETSKILLDYLEERKEYYQLPGDAIKDMLIFTANLFLLKEGFKRYYKYFLESYMDNLFSEISQRKSPKKTTITTSKEESLDKPEIISQDNKKNVTKKCPEGVEVFLNDALGEFVNHEDIKKYIIRLYLNGKSIRINDIVSKFPSIQDLFTKEFIQQSKEIGIIFENGNCKKVENTDTERLNTTNVDKEKDETEEPKIQVEDEVKVAFERKIDWFLKNPALLDGKGFVDLMKLAGYEIENENYVARCFKKLYHNTQMKQVFLNELKRDAFSQKKYSLTKKCYRKIEIYQKKAHRILFLKDNKTIDGIYSHDDYENRVAMFLKN